MKKLLSPLAVYLTYILFLIIAAKIIIGMSLKIDQALPQYNTLTGLLFGVLLGALIAFGISKTSFRKSLKKINAELQLKDRNIENLQNKLNESRNLLQAETQEHTKLLTRFNKIMKRNIALDIRIGKLNEHLRKARVKIFQMKSVIDNDEPISPVENKIIESFEDTSLIQGFMAAVGRSTDQLLMLKQEIDSLAG